MEPIVYKQDEFPIELSRKGGYIALSACWKDGVRKFCVRDQRVLAGEVILTSTSAVGYDTFEEAYAAASKIAAELATARAKYNDVCLFDRADNCRSLIGSWGMSEAQKKELMENLLPEPIKSADPSKTENESEMVNLWARLGVSISVTQEELKILNDKTPGWEDKAQKLLLDLIRSERCRLDGETYFPMDANEKHLGREGELEFDLNSQPLHPEQSRDFTVDTPHGTMHIYDKKDEEYPGVWVDLKQENGRDLTLAMVEYIPGGEGTCDYAPAGSWSEMRRQDNEVPPERRVLNTNIQADAVRWYNKYMVTEGFVTRAWPDETHNEENHIRTFHSGYDLPRKKSLDLQMSEAQSRAEQAGKDSGRENKEPER